MGYSLYRLNKSLKRLTTLSLILLAFIFSLACIRKSPHELFALGSPFHSSDISRYTSLFTSLLRPQCENLTSYNMDSHSYWQYYGFQHHMPLNQDTLSNILRITKEQENELTRIHNELLNTYFSPDYKLFSSLQASVNRNAQKDKNRGIVYVSGKEYYWLTILSIKYIRDHLKDTHTPIEVFVPKRDKRDQFCNKMSMVFPKVKCSYFSDFLTRGQLRRLSGYQYKSLALLLTSFNDILYLDSDNIPVTDIDIMFENTNYMSTGFVSWPDFWKRSTNYKFYNMAGIQNYADPISTTPAVESGQILINKQTHLKTLLLAYYYNFYGPEYFYPLFTQGFPGEGDKESFYLASRVVREKAFLITGKKTKSFGLKKKDGKYAGQGILQINPGDASKYWFVHMNYPKLDIVKMWKDGFFKINNSQATVRQWTIVRNAQDDGKSIGFRQALGEDVEYIIWHSMIDILTKDFKGFRLFEEIGNDEMGDFVKEHVKLLQNSKSNVV